MKKAFLPILLWAMLPTMWAKAQTGVEAYVSASGYVIYDVSNYHTGDAGYAFSFEADYDAGRLLDWSAIDADGDGHTWKLSPEAGFGHLGSDGVMFSYSYDNATAAALSPDNFFVSPLLSITESNRFVSFFASALDEAYPNEHFGLCVSTSDPETPSAFTVVRSGTARAATRNIPPTFRPTPDNRFTLPSGTSTRRARPISSVLTILR